MANLKDIKRRIGSVKNTRQITRAMKMVAAAKMRRAHENVLASRPYEEKMLQVLNSLARRAGDSLHPLLEHREAKNILIVLFSSDKGLCGGFNATLFRRTNELIHENEGKGIYLSVVGRKAKDFYSGKNVIMEKSYIDFSRDIGPHLASEIGKDAVKAFMSEKVDKVYTVFNRFKSVIAQEVIVRPLLPLIPEETDSDEFEVDYIYEPSAEAILGDILVKYVDVEIYQSLLESWASENGARMAAMDSATRNAGEMISKLTLQYNRARQAAITTEIIEIVSGAKALEG